MKKAKQNIKVIFHKNKRLFLFLSFFLLVALTTTLIFAINNNNKLNSEIRNQSKKIEVFEQDSVRSKEKEIQLPVDTIVTPGSAIITPVTKAKLIQVSIYGSQYDGVYYCNENVIDKIKQINSLIEINKAAMQECKTRESQESKKCAGECGSLIGACLSKCLNTTSDYDLVNNKYTGESSKCQYECNNKQTSCFDSCPEILGCKNYESKYYSALSDIDNLASINCKP